ncbi:type II toxin-antitoxin system HigB family toxin [Deinococcus sp. Arct2-2]|nr:type II toxin-antitoxin system HigB family toxin [Deinococcus sp. Arct2-2]
MSPELPPSTRGYQTQYALIKHVLTHKQYDQWTKERR